MPQNGRFSPKKGHFSAKNRPKTILSIMDRNLGALSGSASDETTYRGLYYQFGRPNPFASSTKYNISSTADFGNLAFGPTTELTYLISHPGICVNARGESDGPIIYNNKWPESIWNNPDDWYNPHLNNTSKTYFDPCPLGWQVPEPDIWLGILKSANGQKVEERGAIYFLNGTGDGQSSYFPKFTLYYSCKPGTGDPRRFVQSWQGVGVCNPSIWRTNEWSIVRYTTGVIRCVQEVKE